MAHGYPRPPTGPKPDDALHVAAAKVLKHAQPVHYATPVQAGSGAFSAEEDRDQRRRALPEEDHWPIEE